MSISKEEFNNSQANEATQDEGSTSSQPPSIKSSEDTHQFHSPLNSNAIITIITEEPIDIQPLLQNHETFELLPSHPPFIKIKFIDKLQAQQLQDEILSKYPNLEISIEFDALTHPGNLYVRGLGPEITTQDLYRIFEPFGEITSLKIVTDEFGRSKGYGFINFLKGESADEAITKLNGLLVNGSKLYLNHHIAKKERLERMDFEKSNFTNLYIKNLPSDYTLEQFQELFEKFGEINSTFLPDLNEQQQQQQDETNGSLSPKSGSPSSISQASKRFGFVNFKNHESAIAAIEELDDKEISPGYILSVSRAQRRDERSNDHYLPGRNSTTSISSISPTSAPLLFQPPTGLSPNPISTAPLHTTSIMLNSPPPPPTFLSHITTPQQPLTSSSNFTSLPPDSSPLISLPLPGPNHQPTNLYVKNLSPTIDDDSLHSAFAPFGIIVSAKVMTMPEDGTSRGFGFVCYRTSPEASRAMLAMNGNVLDGNMLHVSFAQKNSRRKFQGRNNSNGSQPLPLDYPIYYNQYQPDFQPLFYGSTGANGNTPIHIQNANNGFMHINMMRPIPQNAYTQNNGNGYQNKPYYGNSGSSPRYSKNGYDSSSQRSISEYNKKIIRLTSEISTIEDEDLKISKISKFLIIPKLLNMDVNEGGLSTAENVEDIAKEFIKAQIEHYRQQETTNPEITSDHKGNDVYLDLISDWANDENILAKELENLSL